MFSRLNIFVLFPVRVTLPFSLLSLLLVIYSNVGSLPPLHTIGWPLPLSYLQMCLDCCALLNGIEMKTGSNPPYSPFHPHPQLFNYSIYCFFGTLIKNYHLSPLSLSFLIVTVTAMCKRWWGWVREPPSGPVLTSLRP